MKEDIYKAVDKSWGENKSLELSHLPCLHACFCLGARHHSSFCLVCQNFAMRYGQVDE